MKKKSYMLEGAYPVVKSMTKTYLAKLNNATKQKDISKMRIYLSVIHILHPETYDKLKSILKK